MSDKIKTENQDFLTKVKASIDFTAPSASPNPVTSYMRSRIREGSFWQAAVQKIYEVGSTRGHVVSGHPNDNHTLPRTIFMQCLDDGGEELLGVLCEPVANLTWGDGIPLRAGDLIIFDRDGLHSPVPNPSLDNQADCVSSEFIRHIITNGGLTSDEYPLAKR